MHANLDDSPRWKDIMTSPTLIASLSSLLNRFSLESTTKMVYQDIPSLGTFTRHACPPSSWHCRRNYPLFLIHLILAIFWIKKKKINLCSELKKSPLLVEEGISPQNPISCNQFLLPVPLAFFIRFSLSKLPYILFIVTALQGKLRNKGWSSLRTSKQKLSKLFDM